MLDELVQEGDLIKDD